MKFTRSIIVIATAALCCSPFLTGCTPAAQAKAKAVAATVGQQTIAAAETAVISAAVSSADKSNKQSFLALVGQNLKAQAPMILSAANVQAAVAAVTPDKSHWTELAAQLAQIYATANPSTDPEKQAVIQAIVTGLNQAAGPAASPTTAQLATASP